MICSLGCSLSGSCVICILSSHHCYCTSSGCSPDTYSNHKLAFKSQLFTSQTECRWVNEVHLAVMYGIVPYLPPALSCTSQNSTQKRLSAQQVLYDTKGNLISFKSAYLQYITSWDEIIWSTLLTQWDSLGLFSVWREIASIYRNVSLTTCLVQQQKRIQI